MKINQLFCLFILLICGCCKQPSNPANSPVGLALEGAHPLRSLYSYTSTSGALNGSFISIHGNINETTKVRFCWLNNEHEYIISELPFNKIRFLVDNNITQPMIKFKWKAWEEVLPYGEIMDSRVVYALIICREKDIPELK